MEQPQQTSKGKENLSDFDDDLMNPQSHDPSLLQLIDLKLGKRVKTKSKFQKPAATGIRPGDWVCLICSNLNFSFRNECNRCQMQTKRQNYLESLQLFSENRKLEKDLNNQNYSDLPEFHKKSKSTSLADLCLDINLIPPPGFETYSQGSLDSLGMDSDYCTNSGFESVILLTPPKISKNRERLHCREGSELDFLPYKSPQKLPSVSPILKNILKEDLNKRRMSTNVEGYGFEKAFNFISEAFCYEEYDPYYTGSEDETNDSANTGRKMSSDEQEEAEEIDLDPVTEDMLQELQLSFIDEYPKIEDITKGNCKSLGKCEWSVEKKACEDPKKPKKERKSDWICMNCGNLNYSFRKYCNRCQILR